MAVVNDEKVDASLVECQQLLLELCQAISLLAPDLKAAAEEMALRRELPERSLIGRLEGVWSSFDRLRDALRSALESLALPVLPNSLETLADVEEAIKAAVKESIAAANWQEERSFAIQMLSALSRTECATNPDWEPLAEFRTAAENLRACFERNGPAAGAVDDARTAFSAFRAIYRLLTDGPALSFNERMALPDQARAAISEQIVFAALGSLIALPAVESPPKVDGTRASGNGERDAHSDDEVKVVSDDAGARAMRSGSAEANDGNPPASRGIHDQALINLQARSEADLLRTAVASQDISPAAVVEVDEGTVYGKEAATLGGGTPRCETAKVPCWTAPPNDVAAAIAAAAARSLSGQQRLAALNDLVWRLLSENRLAPAWYISQALEEQSGIAEVPAALVESLLCAPLLLSSIGSVADRLRDSLSSVRLSWPPIPESQGENGEEVHSVPKKLLMLAATLRPAILAPGSGALELLRQLRFKGDLEILNQLVEVVLAPARSHLSLTLALLQQSQATETWGESRLAVRERARNWLDHNRHCKVVYQPTTEVWHAWLRDTGPIGSIIERVGSDEDDDETQKEMLALVRSWRDFQTVDKRLRQTDSELRKVNARRIPIEAKAVRAIRQKCAEAVELVSEWLGLLERRPGHAPSWDAEQAAQYRSRLLTVLGTCQSALKSHIRSPITGLQQSAAIVVVERSLADLSAMLQPRDQRAPPIRNVLFGDLLKTPSIRLDSDWAPESFARDDVLDAVLVMLSEPKRDWLDELMHRWEERDFFKAAAIIEILEDQTLSPDNGRSVDILAIREEQQSRLDESRRALGELKRSVLERLLNSRLRGLVNEDERLRLTERLTAIAETATLRVGDDRHAVERLREELNVLEIRHLDGFRAELEQSRLYDRFPAAAARVAQVLESKDLVTVREYITILEERGSLPDIGYDAPGGEFFPAFIERMDGVLRGSEKQDLHGIEARIRSRDKLGPLNFEELLTPGEARECADAIRARRRLRGLADKEECASLLQKLFEFIGFTVNTVRPATSAPRGSHRWYDLDARPLHSREDCPLWEFGSRCQGQYRVVLLDAHPLEDEIVRETRDDGRSAVIAIFFGVMSDRRRRDLAHALRRLRDRRLIVLDDALLLFLCTQKRRLLAFFNAACGFCALHPYTTTSGLVPPEMFFGRKAELKLVFEPAGTNLVYGGRQLGKTALLKEVRRQYHRPQQGVIVEFFDLEHGENLGKTRPMEDIWMVIASALEQHGVLPRNTRKPESIQQKIEEWLKHDHQRRIVLLLDEADRFLDSDATGDWLLVGRLKTMMLATDQRFKVVFSGLHNVQRTSHDVNTPLAHLGRPLCVGPFLHRDELRDAIAMVRVPFEALGYRFANPDLIGRILVTSQSGGGRRAEEPGLSEVVRSAVERS